PAAASLQQAILFAQLEILRRLGASRGQALSPPVPSVLHRAAPETRGGSTVRACGAPPTVRRHEAPDVGPTAGPPAGSRVTDAPGRAARAGAPPHSCCPARCCHRC